MAVAIRIFLQFSYKSKMISKKCTQVLSALNLSSESDTPGRWKQFLAAA